MTDPRSVQRPLLCGKPSPHRRMPAAAGRPRPALDLAVQASLSAEDSQTCHFAFNHTRVHCQLLHCCAPRCKWALTGAKRQRRSLEGVAACNRSDWAVIVVAAVPAETTEQGWHSPNSAWRLMQQPPPSPSGGWSSCLVSYVRVWQRPLVICILHGRRVRLAAAPTTTPVPGPACATRCAAMSAEATPLIEKLGLKQDDPPV